MAKRKPTKRNPPDSTVRNVRASHNRDNHLAARCQALEGKMAELVADLSHLLERVADGEALRRVDMKAIQARVLALEQLRAADSLGEE